MRYGKIAPKVANVTCGRKTLTDKEQTYPETRWPRGHFDDLVRRGFLVEVEGKEREFSNPVEPKMIKKKLTKKDLHENPELKEQGLKPGDEIDIPAPLEEPKKESEKEEEEL